MLQVIKQWWPAWLKDFGRFALVGISNTVIDFLIYVGLTRGSSYFSTHYLQANVCAFLVANLNSFFWNRRFTFRSGTSGVQGYPVFLVVSALYLAAVQLGMWALVSGFGLYDVLAKVIVVGIATGLYFLVLKTWVFKKDTLGASATPEKTVH